MTAEQFDCLTPRQREILGLLEQGYGNKQIARRLWLSPETVRNHVRAVYRELGVHSRLEAVAASRQFAIVRAMETLRGHLDDERLDEAISLAVAA